MSSVASRKQLTTLEKFKQVSALIRSLTVTAYDYELNNDNHKWLKIGTTFDYESICPWFNWFKIRLSFSNQYNSKLT